MAERSLAETLFIGKACLAQYGSDCRCRRFPPGRVLEATRVSSRPWGVVRGISSRTQESCAAFRLRLPMVVFAGSIAQGIPMGNVGDVRGSLWGASHFLQNFDSELAHASRPARRRR